MRAPIRTKQKNKETIHAEKEIIVFLLFINTLFPIPYAGFFAKSHIIFFSLINIQFCPPLKNDGRVEMSFANEIIVVTKGKNINRKLSPLVGESVNRQVDERGKCEQTRKNENKCEQKRKE